MLVRDSDGTYESIGMHNHNLALERLLTSMKTLGKLPQRLHSETCTKTMY